MWLSVFLRACQPSRKSRCSCQVQKCFFARRSHVSVSGLVNAKSPNNFRVDILRNFGHDLVGVFVFYWDDCEHDAPGVSDIDQISEDTTCTFFADWVRDYRDYRIHRWICVKMEDEALQRSGAEIFLRENRTRETASSTEPSLPKISRRKQWAGAVVRNS